MIKRIVILKGEDRKYAYYNYNFNSNFQIEKVYKDENDVRLEVIYGEKGNIIFYRDCYGNWHDNAILKTACPYSPTINTFTFETYREWQFKLENDNDMFGQVKNTPENVRFLETIFTPIRDKFSILYLNDRAEIIGTTIDANIIGHADLYANPDMTDITFLVHVNDYIHRIPPKWLV